MQPWVIDANNIHVEDISSLQDSILYSNPAIGNFLSKSNRTKLIVIAPKGYGKTLLLKAKRGTVERVFSKVLPEDALVDKPGTVPSVIKSTGYDQLRESENYWKSCWLIAITICILFYTKNRSSTDFVGLEKLKIEEKVSACDLFDQIVALNAAGYHAVKEVYNRTLLPAFRAVTPLSRFLYITLTNTLNIFFAKLRVGALLGGFREVSGTMRKSVLHWLLESSTA